MKIRGIEGKVKPIIMGNMYVFRYSPITRVSGYYDLFPLVMITKGIKNGVFEGLNFHYMEIKRRLELFEAMRKYFSDNPLTNDSRLLAKNFRKLIFSTLKFRDAKISFKRYLKRRITSSVIQITPTEWKNTISIPKTERFLTVGNTSQNIKQVWRETLKRSRRT